MSKWIPVAIQAIMLGLRHLYTRGGPQTSRSAVRPRQGSANTARLEQQSGIWFASACWTSWANILILFILFPSFFSASISSSLWSSSSCSCSSLSQSYSSFSTSASSSAASASPSLLMGKINYGSIIIVIITNDGMTIVVIVVIIIIVKTTSWIIH